MSDDDTYATPRRDKCHDTCTLPNVQNVPQAIRVETHTFAFSASLNPLALIVLTRESLGYKAAETKDGTIARAKANRCV